MLVVGGAYFLAASMVFPSWGSDVRDLDEHFMDVRRVSLLAIAACNLVFFIRVAMATAAPIGWWWWGGNILFVMLLVLAAFARDRRVILSILTILLVAHGAALILD